MASPAWRRGRAALQLFALGTAIGLLLFAQQYLDDLTSGDAGNWLRPLVKELSGSYAAMVLLPGIIWAARRFPLSGRGWVLHVPLHLLGAALFGALHTLIMLGLRNTLLPALGLEPWDPGPLLARYARGLPIHLIAYTIALATTQIFDRYRAARDRQLEAAELRSRLTEAQLLALQRQLEPHFLASTLKTISELIYNKPKAADEMIGRLSALLKHAFKPQRDPETTLGEEVRLLDLYLDLMRVRFAERLFVRVDVPAELRQARVPRLLLQPLVDNALRHAADPTMTLVSVQVEAREENGQLLIRVRDHGPAGSADAHREDVGLSNTEERIQRLYGNGYGMSRGRGAEDSSELRVRLPLKTS
ncbi:MAG: histidine kinase [Rhodanobacteraceae bacterium]|nr:histidine kinase [Xanthomonadales bacterium]MCP5477226.1 histidine kinase [Rhodanobacteraceae bacterium]HPF74479.1 histidine kinase [Xanthomonadaceae bacterium]HRY00828.1 histidine kinase [Xanthomonadaceae bacterium]